MRHDEIDAEELMYLTVGEFVVKYERMVEIMRAWVTAILLDSGLNSLRLAYASTGKLHASEIRDILMSVSHEWFQAHPNETMKKVADNTLFRIQKMLQHRNLIVHGYATYQAPNDLNASIGTKWVHSRTGLGATALPSVNEINVRTDEIWSITKVLLLLEHYVKNPNARTEMSEGMIFDSSTTTYRHKNDNEY